MKYQEFRPHLLLSDHIDAYWTLRYHDTDLMPQKILPDGCVDIIVNFGADCVTDNGAFKIGSEKICLVGTMTTFTSSILAPGTDMIAVRFKPAAFLNFYNFNALHEVVNQTIDLEFDLCPDLYQIARRKVQYLDEYFLKKLAPRDDSICGLVSQLESSKRPWNVRNLAKQYGTNERQLERRFKQQIGVSPKTYINIVRNKAALLAVRERTAESLLLEIALEYGYYDLSHFSKEIRNFTGSPPSVF